MVEVVWVVIEFVLIVMAFVWIVTAFVWIIIPSIHSRFSQYSPQSSQ